MGGSFEQDVRGWIERAGKRPTVLTRLRFCMFSPGLQFVAAYRFTSFVHRLPLVGRLLGQIVWVSTCNLFKSEIALGATVGPGLYVPHPYGIVIGSAEIGANVTILQNVTIGALKRGDKENPAIENDAFIGAGAVILGGITVGAGAVVGANSVVLCDVPSGALAVGVPATIKNNSRQ